MQEAGAAKPARLVLVDGHSLAHRAYFALFAAQRRFVTTDGRPTGAAYGFLNMLLRMLEDNRPSHVAVVFDAPGPTYRHEQFADYKAQRPEMASELGQQMDTIRALLQAMRVPALELSGYEADDLLGTMACRLAGPDLEVLILTGDRDALQLVGEHVRCILTIKGVTETTEYDPAGVREAYGIEPPLMRDVKALMGDVSDNVPGIKGIGEKTALKLVREFGPLEGIYEHLDEVRGRPQKLLAAGREAAFLSRELVTINCAAPLEVDLAELSRVEPDHPEFTALLRSLEFESVIKRLYPAGAPAAAADGGDAESPTEPAVAVEAVRSAAELAAAVDWLLDCERLGVELLPDGPRPSLAGIRGFGLAGERAAADGDHGARRRAFWVPVAGAAEDLFEGDAEAEAECDVLAALARLLGSPVAKVVHDAKTALVILGRRGVKGCGVDEAGWASLPGLEMDTAVAAYLIDPARAKYDLEKLASEYLRREVPAATSEPTFEAIGRRAAALLDLQGALEAELRARELDELWEEVELPLITVLAHMELTGVRLDLPALEGLGQEFSARLAELTAQIHELAEGEFNVNSPRQLGEVLFERLGLPAQKKTRKGKVASTDAESLAALAEKHPIVPLVIEHRMIQKLKGTYVDGLRALVDPADGAIRTVFNQTVTTTGRLSSTEPNLQNIPIREETGRRLRRAFVAAGPENVLLAADYSQIELRILAHISEDPVLIEAFELGQDIHRRTAAEVFGVELAEVTSDMRQAAKAVNFGIIYGISDFGLARNLGVGKAEAGEYISQYFAKYPRVDGFFRETIAAARADGYVTTLLGRRRYLPDLYDRNYNIRAFGERTARNTPIQGSAADIIKVAMVTLDEEIRRRGWRSRMVLQVHDELLFDTARAELAELRPVVVECMQGAYRLRLPLRVDVRVGDNWYEAKHA